MLRPRHATNPRRTAPIIEGLPLNQHIKPEFDLGVKDCKFGTVRLICAIEDRPGRTLPSSLPPPKLVSGEFAPSSKIASATLPSFIAALNATRSLKAHSPTVCSTPRTYRGTQGDSTAKQNRPQPFRPLRASASSRVREPSSTESSDTLSSGHRSPGPPKARCLPQVSRCDL